MKMKGKLVQCMLCRGPSSRRGTCTHEDQSEETCHKLRSIQTDPSSRRRTTRFAFLESDSEEESSSEDEDVSLGAEGEYVVTNNQSVKCREIYFPRNIRRPLLPCRGELKYIEKLSAALNKVRRNEILVLDERGRATCHNCGAVNKKPNHEGYAREVLLFTLAQGTHKVLVYDWWCDTCQETRRFSGRACGVFPATRHSAYTIELMYVWVQNTCGLGITFRKAYTMTRQFGRSSSIVDRYEKSTENEASKKMEISRRRANAALREFVRLLDTSNPIMTNTLFSCKNCEVSLSADDCEELGNSEEEGRNQKRFKAVVIDGTTAGILSELPDYERDVVSVPAPRSGLSSLQKLVKKDMHAKVLKKLLRMARECLRNWKKKNSNHPTTTPISLGSEYLQFWIRNPAKRNIVGVEQPETGLSVSDCKFTRLFFSDSSCICSEHAYEQALNDQHTVMCDALRKKFLKAKEQREVIDVLNQVISVTQINSSYGFLFPFDEHAPLVNPVEEDDDDKEDDDDDEGDDNDERENEGVLNDTAAPFAERESSRPSPATRATLLLPLSKSGTQFIESVLALLELLILEHIAMPYVGRISGSSGEHNSSTQNAPFSMMKYTEKSVKLHENLIKALEKYMSCLHFLERGRRRTVPVECDCLSGLKKATMIINEANPVLGIFSQEFLKLKRPLLIPHISLVSSIKELLLCHMNVARNYFFKLEQVCSQESKTYWRLYGNLHKSDDTAPLVTDEEGPPGSLSNQTKSPSHHSEEKGHTETDGDRANNTRTKNTKSKDHEQELEDSHLSGICFPGRRSCRPCIVFKNVKENACTKKYKRSKSHTPGLLTVQCACSSPKLMGVVVMIQAESTALALSAVLSHFRIPPRTVYYDNACNLFLSVMLRVPWLLEYTRLPVDRFHYKSHKCGAYFNPDVYREFDTQYTETAESINSRIGKCLPQLRYLSGNNITSYLRTMFALANLSATYRQKYKKDDLEDEDLPQFFRETIACVCESCKEWEE